MFMTMDFQSKNLSTQTWNFKELVQRDFEKDFFGKLDSNLTELNKYIAGLYS